MASVPKAHPDAFVLKPAFGGCDVLQVDWGAVSLPHNQIFVLTSFAELALWLKKEGVMLAVKLTRTRVTRPAFYCRRKVIDRQVASCHRRRVCLDAHGRLSAEHSHLADSRQNADALTDLSVGVVIELPLRRAVTGQADVHDRLVVWIGFGKRRRARQVYRQLRRRSRDRCLHISRCRVYVLGKIKLQHEAAVSLAVIGSN